MDYARHIARRLHEEHLASLGLLGRFEEALARAARRAPAAGWGELARTLCTAFEAEVARHFEFEERELFPRLAAAGEPDIGELLAEEHAAIREAAAVLMPLLGATIAETPATADWNTLRIRGLEFVERMQAHIQKEEMALLPMIDDLIDAETDETLAMSYAV